MKKFKTMPIGWKIDKTWGSPIAGYVPICDGVSLLNGGKKGLLKIKPMDSTPKPIEFDTKSTEYDVKSTESVGVTNQKRHLEAKAINDLARAKFKKQLLEDLTVDLMVCKIEGYDIKEYISDLKELINNTANSIMRK